MATSYQSFIDQAVQMFTRGNDPTAVSSDIGMTAQVLTPNIFQDLTIRYSGNERQRQLLKQTFTVAATNGVATIDPSILTSAMDGSLFYDPADLTAFYSFQRNYIQLFGSLDPRIGYYSLEYGDRLRIVQPGTAFSPTSGATQSFSLTVAAIPLVPTLATDPIVAADEFISDAIEALSEALRGAAVPA